MIETNIPSSGLDLTDWGAVSKMADESKVVEIEQEEAKLEGNTAVEEGAETGTKSASKSTPQDQEAGCDTKVAVEEKPVDAQHADKQGVPDLANVTGGKEENILAEEKETQESSDSGNSPQESSAPVESAKTSGKEATNESDSPIPSVKTSAPDTKPSSPDTQDAKPKEKKEKKSMLGIFSKLQRMSSRMGSTRQKKVKEIPKIASVSTSKLVPKKEEKEPDRRPSTSVGTPVTKVESQIPEVPTVAAKDMKLPGSWPLVTPGADSPATQPSKEAKVSPAPEPAPSPSGKNEISITTGTSVNVEDNPSPPTVVDPVVPRESIPQAQDINNSAINAGSDNNRESNIEKNTVSEIKLATTQESQESLPADTPSTTTPSPDPTTVTVTKDFASSSQKSTRPIVPALTLDIVTKKRSISSLNTVSPTTTLASPTKATLQKLDSTTSSSSITTVPGLTRADTIPSPLSSPTHPQLSPQFALTASSTFPVVPSTPTNATSTLNLFPPSPTPGLPIKSATAPIVQLYRINPKTPVQIHRTDKVHKILESFFPEGKRAEAKGRIYAARNMKGGVSYWKVEMTLEQADIIRKNKYIMSVDVQRKSVAEPTSSYKGYQKPAKTENSEDILFFC